MRRWLARPILCKFGRHALGGWWVNHETITYQCKRCGGDLHTAQLPEEWKVAPAGRLMEIVEELKWTGYP